MQKKDFAKRGLSILMALALTLGNVGSLPTAFAEEPAGTTYETEFVPLPESEIPDSTSNDEVEVKVPKATTSVSEEKDDSTAETADVESNASCRLRIRSRPPVPLEAVHHMKVGHRTSYERKQGTKQAVFGADVQRNSREGSAFIRKMTIVFIACGFMKQFRNNSKLTKKRCFRIL